MLDQTLPHPNFILLYVSNPQQSTTFYQTLLGCEPIESSATFAMFALNSGVMLGLWSRETVLPAASGQSGNSEIAMTVGNKESVLAMYQLWTERGITIIQEPTAMDFGFTFVATDADGHRIRVFAPAA